MTKNKLTEEEILKDIQNLKERCGSIWLGHETKEQEKLLERIEDLKYGLDMFRLGYQKAQEDVLKIINDLLYDYHERLEDERLPELTQANLSGMILSLEELKKQIQEKQKEVKGK